MTTNSAEDEPVIDTLTAWRYWHLPARLGQRRDLRNVNPKDQTVWGRGVNHAVCRHNPQHTPPHPGCSCGIYVMQAVDIQLASATHYYAADEYQRIANLGRHGTLGIPEKDGFIDARVPWIEEQASYYQQYDVVIGRVRAFNVVRHQRPPDNPDQLPCWRAGTALLEALYLSNRVTRDAEQLRAKFSEKYAVPCEIGYPPYTQEEWDNRAKPDGLNDTEAKWADVGLYPPGKTAPPPRRYFTATASGRDRKPLQTWTEQT
ncbi:hypothetical protein [Mycobacterium sp. IDR2000157661]|uniref:hypothetical protein n=1 Tax=Mycobacterium sp. IDR2000157661 TaxID=2867005 RepID=UPI001EEAFD0A|nr:hypothetical protein [Mycobacterium sp. IDR2000157661]ULE32579.1 hypothetical protein K3G64_21180 [Mycobacterium sp. IDR2000157661]